MLAMLNISSYIKLISYSPVIQGEKKNAKPPNTPFETFGVMNELN